jgi:hypothetical protein
MDDSQNDTVRVDFDLQIKLEFHNSTVIRGAGLFSYHELHDALRLTSPATTAGLRAAPGLVNRSAAFPVNEPAHSSRLGRLRSR